MLSLLQAPHDPETVLELAFIDDPAVFERDGQTRRSPARADLKARTGWSDEQIEGWRIMLERDVRPTRSSPTPHDFELNYLLVFPPFTFCRVPDYRSDVVLARSVPRVDCDGYRYR